MLDSTHAETQSIPREKIEIIRQDKEKNRSEEQAEKIRACEIAGAYQAARSATSAWPRSTATIARPPGRRRKRR